MDGDERRLTACHWLLLRLAGTAPDDLITQCRHWLAQRRMLDIGRAVTHAVLSYRIPLTDPDLEVLAGLLTAEGADSVALSLVDVTDLDPMPLYGFAPTRTPVDAATGVVADARPDAAAPADPEDDRQLTAICASEHHLRLRAIWRAWRYPGDGAPWPPPRRVYVVETDPNADLVGIASDLQHRLSTVDEPDPQVEVYPFGTGAALADGTGAGELPSYQRLARAYGALLWAREPDPGVQIAAVFDSVDDSGPWLAPDHATVAEAELANLTRYLRGGEPLLVTMARMADVVDPGRPQRVPINFRTDGFWVWSEATTYYLERYRLAPDPGLLAHIRERRYAVPEVDGAALYRALAVLQEPATDEPAWTYTG
jgi:hypothetical protein